MIPFVTPHPRFSVDPVSTRQLLILLSLLLALAMLLYLPWLGYLDLLLEEPRRALVARAMLESGDWWVPMHGGELYLSKPPLFNWLIAAFSLPLGVINEWSARLPSLLGLIALTVFFVISNRHRLGPWGLWFLGCGFLVTPEFMVKSRLAEIDVVFTLLVAASIWVWFLADQAGRRGLALWGPPLLLVALAFMTKREPALVFFYLSVGPYLLLRGRWRELFSVGHLGALLIPLLLVGGWLSIMAAEAGWESLLRSVYEQLLNRGQGGTGSAYVVHLLTYPLQILVALLPFSLLLFGLSRAEWRQAVFRRYGEAAVFCALALAANLPLYWFKGEVAVRYFMPMFPFVLVLGAMLFETVIDTPAGAPSGRRRWLDHLARILCALSWLLAGLLAASAALPWLAPERLTLMPWPLPPALALLAGWWSWRLCRVGAASRLVVLPTLALLLGLLVRGLQFNVVLPNQALKMQQRQNGPAVAQVLQQARAGGLEPIHAYRDIPSGVWFYAPSDLFLPLPDPRRLQDHGLVLFQARHRRELAERGLGVAQRLTSVHYEGDELILARMVQRRADAVTGGK